MQLSLHSNTCCVRRYTTCVPGYTTVSVDIQHVFVVTLDVAGVHNLNSCICGHTTRVSGYTDDYNS